MFPNLEAEMARLKISRRELAKRINRTPTTTCNKLNGKAPITLEECAIIRKELATDKSIDYLFATKEAEDVEQ